jgi:four helix bundle protein
MQDFRDLLVWQCAHELTLSIYRATRGSPREEMFGVTSQIRRSAASVAANIAEGNGRASRKEYAQFLATERGSLNETRYFLILSRDLGYLTTEGFSDAEQLVHRTAKLLQGLIRSLRPPQEDRGDE